MEFSPNYFTAAVIISVCGLLIIVLIFLFEYKNGRLVKRFFEKPQSGTEAEAVQTDSGTAKPLTGDSKTDKTS